MTHIQPIAKLLYISGLRKVTVQIRDCVKRSQQPSKRALEPNSGKKFRRKALHATRRNFECCCFACPRLSLRATSAERVRASSCLSPRQLTMPPSRARRAASAQGYQPLRGENEPSASLFPSLGRRVSPDRAERPAERPLDRNQRVQPQPTVNKIIAPGQVQDLMIMSL